MSSFNIGQYIYKVDDTNNQGMALSEQDFTVDTQNGSKAYLVNGFFSTLEHLCDFIIESQSNVIETFNIYLSNSQDDSIAFQRIYAGSILPKQRKEIIFSFIPIHNNFDTITIVNEVNENKKIVIQRVGLYTGSNLIADMDNIDTLKKIGIQAEPDSVFLINGEVITVGQSGIYEFLNGLVEVYSIAPIKVDKNFILDYQY